MKKSLAALVSTFVLASSPAWAAMQTVTLAVPGMTCPVCPITVKKALQKVDGVTQVEVSYEKKEAVVTFDDVKTTAESLTQATAGAGYPSTVKGAAR
ncbi:mercury resistance system periplasmic binding protein MerP [Methylocaldum sp. BRCS4]|jgi:mercuric ion binding protein|uniref:mercury resistance system periplasmic binding protein MerP n=1 Tax=Methylocaldum sp. 14B TaxID=1912213 RepID=UPI00098BB643|nr:mercury resistance system periplasmic binding protein MerP [Methylocaldum sp. 14B]MVF23090.1 mercury resistance system periplasmic binding protein MerP [Methylocaldum sp. BRCS4]